MPSAVILPVPLAIPRSSNRPLSSCWTFTGPDLFRTFSIASSSLSASSDLASVAIIHMGGGPRTFPGGVSKWQWKRMQAKKSKQLLKARLCRERQLYEMRKRAELKAAISELERPWEAVERAPVLFSVSADEQIKALADRFQRPSGFDMWSERDGPRLFRSPNDLPSARFFPKGAVHSVKPYGIVAGELTEGGEEGEKEMRNDDWITKGTGRYAMVLPDSSSLASERSVSVKEENGDAGGNRQSYYSDSELLVVSSRKAEDKMASGSYGSDSEPAVDISRLNGDNMVRDFGRRGGRVWNWDSRGSNSKSAEEGSRIERQETAGSFGRRGCGGGSFRYRDSYGSHSKSAVTGSSMKRDEMAGNFRRRYGTDRTQSSSESYSDLAITGSKMPRREKNSYRSYWEHEKDKNENGVDGSRIVLPDSSSLESEGSVSVEEENGNAGGNRRSYYSDSEHLVVSSSKAEDKMADRFRHYRGNRGSHESDSERVVDSSRLNGDDIVSQFDGRRGRRRSWDSWGSNLEPGEAGSRMERQKMASSFGRRGRGGGGRGRYWDSYGSHSKLAVTGSSMERHEIASTFGQRYGGGGRNQSSSESYSDLAYSGSRMPRREKTGGFDWRHGRGGRDGNRNSYRSYSEHEKGRNEDGYGKLDERGGNRNAMAGGFDRRGGRGGNRGSYRSYSNLAVAGSRMEREKIIGGFRKRGGRGRNPNSYDSDSELAITDSRKGRVDIAGGRDRDYSNGGRVSLRPTTELRLKDRDLRRKQK